MAPIIDNKARTTPVLDNGKVTIIFVLGEPGAGKGTQCSTLVDKFGFAHLSTGDLLQIEQHREGSQYSKIIREGTVVPVEVIIKLLENSMQVVFDEGRSSEGRGRFLIDEFPPNIDQTIVFDRTVCKSLLVLFSTSKEVMLSRLLERRKTSGWEDDNEDTIKGVPTQCLFIEYYTKLGQVARIGSSVEQVHEATNALIRDVFTGRPV
ncbi:adenylate kinase-domain-containing protein [Infundibulicybe gibba]|nr:adenylate kinase-domain-containing protein [Infundibulicybe gibba]